MESTKERILKLAAQVADGQGISVVDVEMTGSVRKPTVRVFIDKEGGVTLDDCERVSRGLSALLDVEDMMRSSYVLEVSSPGLDRPLRDPGDFEKSVGKLARVVTKEGIDNRTFFIGRIQGVKADRLLLTVGEGEVYEIPFDRISRARLEIEL
jgi:ribosome maturation factor RimP